MTKKIDVFEAVKEHSPEYFVNENDATLDEWALGDYLELDSQEWRRVLSLLESISTIFLMIRDIFGRSFKLFSTSSEQINRLLYVLNHSDSEYFIIRDLEEISSFLNAIITRNQDADKLKDMPYKEFLKTDYWKEISYQAKEIANMNGYGCSLCGDRAQHTHHKTYERKGKEVMEDLTPLCSVCHAKFHDKESSDK